MKAGSYSVSVTTGGNHIYCGQGSSNPCSPFTLTVDPGPTVAGVTEVESLVAPGLDSILEAVAGEVGYMTIQAKDTYGNNKLVGGDAFEAQFKKCSDNALPQCTATGISYKGVVADRKSVV